MFERVQQHLIAVCVIHVERQRKGFVVGKRGVNLTQHQFEVLPDILFTVHTFMGTHGVEIEILLQLPLYSIAELGTNILFPCNTGLFVVSGIERQHKQEVHVVVEQ